MVCRCCLAIGLCSISTATRHQFSICLTYLASYVFLFYCAVVVGRHCGGRVVVAVSVDVAVVIGVVAVVVLVVIVGIDRLALV